MNERIKVGLNGLGRIGRHIFKMCIDDPMIDLVGINEINPDLNNWAYTLNYDSIYGKSRHKSIIKNKSLICNKKEIFTSINKDISNAPWSEWGAKLIIDASGVLENINKSRKILNEEFVEKILHQKSQLIILRVSWLVGPHGKNFISSILNLHSKKNLFSVVYDQIGVISSTLDVAEICWEIISKWSLISKKTHILHWSCEGISSWYDIAIAIGAILGPGIALSLYGGRLAEGEKVKPWMKPIIRLNIWVFDRFHFDNKSVANSGLSKALENRLYFDHYYDMAMLKLVAGFSNKSAETDKNVIDGVIKKIESGSQSISKVVRSMTTGSARDYILMVSVGAIVIFFLLWGVA